MSDDLDSRLRGSMSQLPLPDAPPSLRDAVDRLDDEPVRAPHSKWGVHIGRSASVVLVTAVALVALVAVAGPLVTAQPSAIVSEPTTSASRLESPSAPPDAVATMIVCGRLGTGTCHATIELVRQGDPKSVEEATAIVVDDVCAPTFICDRKYPYDAIVVLVGSSGASAGWPAFEVVGLGEQPERVEPWAGPIPSHVSALIHELSTKPTAPAPELPPYSPSPELTAWLPPWAGPATPAEVLTRPVLPFCGVEEGGFAGLPDAQVRACFVTAIRGGRAAEFASIRSTTEGDPIATITRVLPGGGLEILRDSTQDAFGAGVWTRTICRGSVEDQELGFVPEGCDEPVVIR